MLRHLAPAFVLLALGGTAFAKPCPNIMLVLDQSLSMQQDPDGHDPMDPMFKGPSKWEMLQQVIVDIVQQYGDHVPFGLELFSTNTWHDAIACQNAAMITVPLSHASASDIIKQIQMAKPDADTNTGEAINRAAQDPALMNPSKPDFIILVTDGNPNCNPADIMDPENPGTWSVAQIMAAANLNPPVKTFVIGFDGDTNGVNPIVLDQMAGAGGERVPGCTGSTMGSPCYYRAGANKQEFEDVFDKIVHEAGGGEFGGALCDDSCYALGCPMGQICTTEETDPEPHCVNNPCGGKTCNGDTFCRGGACVGACKNGCATGQKCRDGQCVADKCAGKTCTAPQVCNPADGTCIDSPCAQCTTGGVCDIETGKCVADQCKIITCPKGTTCVDPVGGNCAAGASGGGCDTGRHVDETGLGVLALALVSLAMTMRRRRRRAAA